MENSSDLNLIHSIPNFPQTRELFNYLNGTSKRNLYCYILYLYHETNIQWKRDIMYSRFYRRIQMKLL